MRWYLIDCMVDIKERHCGWSGQLFYRLLLLFAGAARSGCRPIPAPTAILHGSFPIHKSVTGGLSSTAVMGERERERGEWKKKKKENCWFAALQPTTEGSCMTGVAFIDELKGFEDGINRTECEARDTCSKAREDDERLCALLCARQPLLRNNFERDDELQGGKEAEQVFAPSSFSRYWGIERCDDGEAPRDDWSYLGLAVAGIRRRRWISNCSAPFHLMQMLQSTCPVPSGPAVPFLLGPFSPSSSIATGTLAVSDNFS